MEKKSSPWASSTSVALRDKLPKLNASPLVGTALKSGKFFLIGFFWRSDEGIGKAKSKNRFSLDL
jgi:hypothetical protein